MKKLFANNSKWRWWRRRRVAAMAVAAPAAATAALCNKNGKLFKYIIDFMPFVYCKSLDFFYASCVTSDISLSFSFSVSRVFLCSFAVCVCVCVRWAFGIILLPKPINNATTTMSPDWHYIFSRPSAGFMSSDSMERRNHPHTTVSTTICNFWFDSVFVVPINWDIVAKQSLGIFASINHYPMNWFFLFFFSALMAAIAIRSMSLPCALRDAMWPTTSDLYHYSER